MWWFSLSALWCCSLYERRWLIPHQQLYKSCNTPSYCIFMTLVFYVVRPRALGKGLCPLADIGLAGFLSSTCSSFSKGSRVVSKRDGGRVGLFIALMGSKGGKPRGFLPGKSPVDKCLLCSRFKLVSQRKLELLLLLSWVDGEYDRTELVLVAYELESSKYPSPSYSPFCDVFLSMRFWAL